MGEIIGNNDQIIINIEDLVPPSNLATIDKDGNVGNTFSKDQFNEKFQNKSDDLDEKIAEIKAQVETDFQGTLKPTDTAPTVDGSYKPEVLSADPGTNYPNAGNLKAKEGYDTMFFKKGTVWTKSEVKIPGSTAKTTYDKTDNVSPATMKAAADRFDPGITVLDSFVTALKTEELEIIMPLSGETDGAFINTSGGQFAEPNSANGIIPMSELVAYENIVIRGNTESNGAGCVYLAKVMPGGARVNIKIGGNNTDFTHQIDKTAQQYVYSRRKTSTADLPKTQFFKNRLVADIKIDAVKDYMDPARTVLDTFINPTEVVWEEIIMPYSTEVDNEFLNTGFSSVASSIAARGSIPNSEFGNEWTMLKVTGNFNLLGAGAMYMYRYKSSSATNILSGNKGSYKEFIFNVDKTFLGFGYSRVKTSHMFYKGKIVKKEPVLNSVRDYIDAKSSSAGHRMIDAYTDFNVKPSNTAAVNTTQLNAAILEAYVSKRPLYLPCGTIKHNGFNYMPGVRMFGQGGDQTALFNEAGSYAIQNIDPLSSQDFNLGGCICDMTIDGNNIADIGINLKNFFFIKFSGVFFYRFKTLSVQLTGVLCHTFEWCQVVNAGIKILSSDASKFGYMQSNLCQYNFVYFVQIPKLAVDIDRASNIAFRSCNFEGCGTTGDASTGSVKATRVSPGGATGGLGEGVDLTFENCWSESLKGPFLQISNSKGVTTIRDTMVGNAGNTSTNNIINNGCKVLITGSTQVIGSTTGVRTQNNGETRVDGFVRINTHVEETGGVYKQATYS